MHQVFGSILLSYRFDPEDDGRENLYLRLDDSATKRTIDAELTRQMCALFPPALRTRWLLLPMTEIYPTLPQIEAELRPLLRDIEGATGRRGLDLQTEGHGCRYAFVATGHRAIYNFPMLQGGEPLYLVAEHGRREYRARVYMGKTWEHDIDMGLETVEGQLHRMKEAIERLQSQLGIKGLSPHRHHPGSDLPPRDTIL